MASLADYEVAYALAGEVLKETLTDLKKPLREALRAHPGARRANGRDGVAAARSARRCACPDSTVRRWLQDLVDFEYLALVQTDGERGGQGKTVALSPPRP